MIETEHPSESSSAFDGSRARVDPCGTLQQTVPDTLMIALVMVVHHEVANRVPERCRSKEDHSVQTLRLD
jgi:hypothetical protein